MMLSRSKILPGGARPIMVLAACLVFLTAPYLQANQTIRIDAGSTCHCSRHCCCKSMSEADDHCRIVESKRSCHCEMKQAPVPVKAPLDAQTPDSKPSDYQAGDKVMIYNPIAGEIATPALILAPQEVPDSVPIYLSVSSLLI